MLSVSQGTVVLYADLDCARPRRHEVATHTAVAQMIAEVLAYDFGGVSTTGQRLPGQVYFVPYEALLADEAMSPTSMSHDVTSGVARSNTAGAILQRALSAGPEPPTQRSRSGAASHEVTNPRRHRHAGISCRTDVGAARSVVQQAEYQRRHGPRAGPVSWLR